MGFLDSKEKTPTEKRIDELLEEIGDLPLKGQLRRSLQQMARDGKSILEIEQYYRDSVAKTQFIVNRREEYVKEAKLADTVYKAYITDGISRLEKINGRFLASLSIKADILIEQNNRIIQLLEQQITGESRLVVPSFCPECGSKNETNDAFCMHCGAKL
jgi:hypothetical protein